MPLVPVFLTYVLSFVYVGIYWNNHHHLFQAVRRVNGRVLWANLHLLFWLSLLPFATAWMGEHNFAPVPVAVYGVILLLAAVAYYVPRPRRCSRTQPERRAAGRSDRQRHQGQDLAVLYAWRSRSRSSRRWWRSRCTSSWR